MLLTLRILTYRNAPVPATPAVRFDLAGGSIGRSPDNALVLDDPSKYISRVHARVLAQGDTFVLEDVGSNASVVNDRPLGKGSQVALAHGDRVVIGDYLLQAMLEAAPVQPLLAPAPVNNAALPLFEPPPPPAPVQLPPLDFAPAPTAASTPAPQAGAPWSDPLAGSSLLDVTPGQGGLGDFGGDDPLGLNLFAPAAPQRAAESDHVSPELAAFSHAQPMPPPAFVAPKAAPPSGGFAIPDDYDPLADLFPPAAPAAPVVTAPVVTAPVVAAPVMAAPTAAPFIAPVVPTPVPEPDSGDVTHYLAPAPATAAPPPAPSPAPSPPPAPAPAIPAAPAPVPPSTPAPAGAGGDDAVLQALLRGLGLPGLHTGRPATEVAELVGSLLREATAGTMDVLMARALTKKESRIDMTMLSVKANNPLKFFPNADGALTQMLTGAMAGYMAPVEAMAGAFDDLRAHELAVIAGMRAALGAVLHRFDPSAIEARLSVPTVMDKMLASNRKAKMWDRLVELYGDIAREADDDLQRLFSEKFAAAYEEQVERLRQAKRAGSR